MTRNIEAYDAYLLRCTYNEPDPESIRAAMGCSSGRPRWTRISSGLDESCEPYAFASSPLWPEIARKAGRAKADAVMERIKSISAYGQAVYEALAGDRSQNSGKWWTPEKHLENARAIAQKLGLEAYFTRNRCDVRACDGAVHGSDRPPGARKGRGSAEFLCSFLLSMAYAAKGNLAGCHCRGGSWHEAGRVPDSVSRQCRLTALATRDRKQIEQRMALDDGCRECPQGFYSAMKARLDNPPEALARAASPCRNIE